MVYWIVQANQSNPAEVESLARAVEGEGLGLCLVPLERDRGVPNIAGLPPDAPVVCHGAGFITRARNHPRLASGLFFDPAAFRWSRFRREWGEAMLSQHASVMPLSEARSFVRAGGAAFVRPDEDSKMFEGGVYDSPALASACAKVPDETPAVVSAPLLIEAEWRFFIVEGEVADCSQYRRWGRASTSGSVPHAAIDLAIATARRWSPANIFTLDLAVTEGRIGIVEANCFNASRFYAARIDRIVRAVSRSVAATSADRPRGVPPAPSVR